MWSQGPLAPVSRVPCSRRCSASDQHSFGSRTQILGLEALRTREAAAKHKLLIDHMAKLRSLHQLSRGTFVLGLESNLGFEAQVSH